jgi:uncharacterized SAM-dependent methyltransferase
MALERSSRLLRSRGVMDVAACRATYEAGLARITSEWPPAGSRLVLFLGSNIGNLEAGEAGAFLSAIRASLDAGDHVLLGADLVKPAATLERAYDDPLGVTAAFNRNLLVRMNRELGADFDVGAFGHRAVWNVDRQRVEMHLVSAARQEVRIPGARLACVFEAGESIWTESSYKFTRASVAEALEEAGLRLDGWHTDGAQRFALAVATPRRRA